MIRLEKFEKTRYCQLGKFEMDRIKKEIQENISTIIEGLEEGENFYSTYIQSYWKQIIGIKTVCSIVGITVEIQNDELEKVY